MDEARRARLQAKLDAETLKGTLANKVRARPDPRVFSQSSSAPQPGDGEKLNLEMPNPYEQRSPVRLPLPPEPIRDR